MAWSADSETKNGPRPCFPLRPCFLWISAAAPLAAEFANLSRFCFNPPHDS
jgi:hypothetical protein